MKGFPSHTTWDKVFARQEKRAAQAREWLAALPAKKGGCVLDVGSGPGFISLLAADAVGPEGLVVALDRNADALAYLAAQQALRGVTHIRRVVADARAFTPAELGVDRIDGVLLTHMLHHDDDPRGIVAHLGAVLPPGTPVIVAEYDPAGPGDHGPPLDHRLPPERLADWLRQAGFAVDRTWAQADEQYAVRAVRG